MRDMTTDGGAWLRLAQRVVEERAAHGWTQADVADRGGFSVDRLQEIERGQRTAYRPTTLGALERGLYWRHGSVRRVLAGEEPVTTEPAEREVDLSSQTESSDAIVPDVIEAIERDPNLLDDAKQHLLNQYELLLRLPPAVKPPRRGRTPPQDESIEERRERLRREHQTRARRGTDGQQHAGDEARRAVGDGGSSSVGGGDHGSRP